MKHASQLMSVVEASQLIEQGASLVIAGSTESLERLPAGNWIGGTTPYFMTEAGGLCDQQQVFVQALGLPVARIASYDRVQLPHVLEDAPEHGLTLLILPAASQVLEDYAQQAPDYADMFIKPIAGWVAGMHLDQVGQARALVYNGQEGRSYADQAVALHCPLPENLLAHIEIVNLFQPGCGPVLRFGETGFSAADCLVDGQPANLASLIRERQIDTRVPLVADYCGALINVSVQAVDEHKVQFYAPVFAGVDYRFAEPLEDYPSQFIEALPAQEGEMLLGCNCILNYLYSQLEGRCTGALTGPITFGEVAYQLLNQTAVRISLIES